VDESSDMKHDVKGNPPESVTTKEGNHLPQTVLDSVQNFEILPDSARVRPAAVALLFGISMATYWRRVAAGEIPKPKPFFGRAVFNIVGDIRNINR